MPDRPSPISGYQLTREDRIRGGQNSKLKHNAEKLTLRQLLARNVEDVQNAARIWQVFTDALDATVGSCGQTYACPHCGEKVTCPEGIPDHRVRLDAVAKLNAEAFGKPVQPTEERGKGGQPVVFLWGDAAVKAAAAARRTQAAIDADGDEPLELTAAED